ARAASRPGSILPLPWIYSTVLSSIVSPPTAERCTCMRTRLPASIFTGSSYTTRPPPRGATSRLRHSPEADLQAPPSPATCVRRSRLTPPHSGGQSSPLGRYELSYVTASSNVADGAPEAV